MATTCWTAASRSPPCKTCGAVPRHRLHRIALLPLPTWAWPTSPTAGQTTSGKPWDASNGLFGKWDPLTYRYLSQTGDERLDLTTAEWLMVNGARIAGGGPAVTSRDGQPLTSLAPDPDNPETSLLDPPPARPSPGTGQKSGVLEMNCFLCHTPNPNNAARIAAIQAGKFGGANTATLLGTGSWSRSADGLDL